MEKSCTCGDTVVVQLCTVIYDSKVNVDNVPIYSCTQCGKNQLLPEVKEDLKLLIAKYDDDPSEEIKVGFQEVSEISYFYLQLLAKESHYCTVQQLIEERINELLDTFILAKSLQDRDWTEDIYKRLIQLNTLKSQTDATVS